MEPDIHVIPEQFHGAGLKYLPENTAGVRVKGSGGSSGKRTLWIIIGAGVVFLAAIGVGAYFVLQSLEKSPTEPATEAPAQTPSTPSPVVVVPATTSTNGNALNQPAEPEVNAPAPAPTASTALKNSADADFDGLTDKEEVDLYRSGPAKPDTDDDGFLDGLEVLNLYNPAARAPTKLLETGTVAEYQDSVFNFTALIPTGWVKKVLDPGRGSVIFTAPTGEFIQIFVEENPRTQTLADWYLERSPGVSRGELEALTTKQGYLALKSPDRQTTYVAAGARVIIISYNPGEVTELSFRRTYEMSVNSVRIAQP